MASFRNFGRSSSYDRVAAVDFEDGIEDPLGGGARTSNSAGNYSSVDNTWTIKESAVTHFEIGGLDDDDDEHDAYGSDDDNNNVDLENGNNSTNSTRKPKRRQQDVLSMTSASTTSGRPPSNYYCPLTMHLMEDPVLDGCGHCFDREAITSWLNYHSMCPISRKPLTTDDLIPETALQERIQHWKSRHLFSSEPDLLTLSETDSHSQFELMLLPQERKVLAIVKFRKQVRTQREAYIRCVWTVVGIVTVVSVTIAFLTIYLYDVELRGPL